MHHLWHLWRLLAAEESEELFDRYADSRMVLTNFRTRTKELGHLHIQDMCLIDAILCERDLKRGLALGGGSHDNPTACLRLIHNHEASLPFHLCVFDTFFCRVLRLRCHINIQNK